MRNLTYYPGFEVEDANWLKLGLLCIRKLYPIVPSEAWGELSSLHRKLSEDTDFIEVYEPSYNEGRQATFDAIEHVEKILRNPDRYRSVFGTTKVVEKWRSPGLQNYKLFSRKYIGEWEKFCMENGLGRKVSGGFLVEKQLGLLYMTLLAQVISEVCNRPSITDSLSLDSYSVFTRRVTDHTTEKVTVAQAVITLELPVNLQDIPLDTIIQYRNHKHFKKKQKAFHKSLERFMVELESGKRINEFKKTVGESWKTLLTDVVERAATVTAFGLGVWLMLQKPDLQTAEYLKEVATGVALAVGSPIALYKRWTHTRTKKLTRKYLTGLQRLRPKSFPED